MGYCLGEFTQVKIAWFAPFDQSNGIGDYSKHVTNALAKHHEVHLWLFEQEKKQSTLLHTVMYDVTVELSALDQYDMIVYNVGNALFDHKIYDIMRKKAGIVILHKNNKKNLEFALGIVTHSKNQSAQAVNCLGLCTQLPFSNQNIEKYSEKLVAFMHEVRGIKPFLNLIDKATNELNLMGVKGDMPVINTVSHQILTMFGK